MEVRAIRYEEISGGVPPKIARHKLIANGKGSHPNSRRNHFHHGDRIHSENQTCHNDKSKLTQKNHPTVTMVHKGEERIGQ